MIRKKTPHEVYKAGLAALNKALGPADAIRFLLHFDRGSGDYTAERARLLGNPTVDELLGEVKNMRKRKSAKTG